MSPGFHSAERVLGGGGRVEELVRCLRADDARVEGLLEAN